MQPYTPPAFAAKAFNCPFCGAYARQDWGRLAVSYGSGADLIPNSTSCYCTHCESHPIWINDKIVYPLFGSAPLPNADMPEDVKQDYEEARSIVAISPRGTAAPV
jgi:hypothetical protein